MDIEEELTKMAGDPDLMAHLRLGALKALVALRGTPDPAKTSGPVVVMPKRDDGLPPDPLLEEYLPQLDEAGRVVPADPYADLDWAGIVGRAPHALYARVLYSCPWHPTDLGKRGRGSDEAKTLIDAEARFLRACRDRGVNTEVDEVADVRRRRRRSRGGG